MSTKPIRVLQILGVAAFGIGLVVCLIGAWLDSSYGDILICTGIGMEFCATLMFILLGMIERRMETNDRPK